MTLLSSAQNALMLQLTGGVTVVDVATGEDSYGHFENVPVEVTGSEYPGTITTQPSVVVANGAFSAIGHKKGVDRVVEVDGTVYVVRDIQPVDNDGGVFRLMLSEA